MLVMHLDWYVDRPAVVLLAVEFLAKPRQTPLVLDGVEDAHSCSGAVPQLDGLRAASVGLRWLMRVKGSVRRLLVELPVEVFSILRRVAASVDEQPVAAPPALIGRRNGDNHASSSFCWPRPHSCRQRSVDALHIVHSCKCHACVVGGCDGSFPTQRFYSRQTSWLNAPSADAHAVG